MYTDKGESGLLAVYEQHFAAWRERPVKYLEVGILEGGSLLWASRFFAHPESKIIGVDQILPSDLGDPKITMIQGNQNDGAGLARIAVTHGPFDIIIDDGSHFPIETQNTWTHLWPWVKVGGIYAIEDWNAGFTHNLHHRGMETVVTQIVRDKQNWKIGELSLNVYSNLHSLALYRRAGL